MRLRVRPTSPNTAVVMQAVSIGKRRTAILAVVLLVVALLVAGIAGLAWIGWWLNDNIDAPGPAATGSGPCGSAVAVNLQLVYADGHTVQACTRDRPACPNGTLSGGARFTLNNQLRSSSRRYILLVTFDGALPAEAAEQTLSLAPGPGFMPGEPASSTLTSAIVEVTPRDPTEVGYATISGSLTVASTGGVARGQIDGDFIGPTRPDRPTPTWMAGSPLGITGTFACNR
jgi:hypothetical protein